MHEAIAQLAALFPNCFRQPWEPLKIGIHNDVIAWHPELRPSVLANALKAYTRSLGYLETIKVGAARIDLEGNPAGTVRRRTKKTPSGRSPRRPGAPRPNLLRNALDNKTRSATQNLISLRRPDHHVSGWRASKRPHKLAGRGSRPRSDPGSMAA